MKRAKAAFVALLLRVQVALCQHYQLIQEYNASNFFDEFRFFTQPDPTGGFVQYASFETALSTGLVSNDTDIIYLDVDKTNIYPPSGPGRPSVRVESRMTFTEGLFVIDLTHIPVGCGVWPALWTTGLGDWPTDGEIDIIENVNDARTNNAALHATGDCSISGSTDQTGTWKSTDCNIAHDGNQGCGTTFTEPYNYGAEFNANGGGVYAMEWTSNTISIWFFPPATVPEGLLDSSTAPDPATFGVPSASFSGPCSGSFGEKFFNHSIIIDTTFCGGWAGGMFGTGASICPIIDGASPYDSCISYVANNPEAFADAYWGIKSLRVWEKVEGFIPERPVNRTKEKYPDVILDLSASTQTAKPIPVNVSPLTGGTLNLGKAWVDKGLVSLDPEIDSNLLLSISKTSSSISFQRQSSTTDATATTLVSTYSKKPASGTWTTEGRPQYFPPALSLPIPSKAIDDLSAADSNTGTILPKVVMNPVSSATPVKPIPAPSGRTETVPSHFDDLSPLVPTLDGSTSIISPTLEINPVVPTTLVNQFPSPGDSTGIAPPYLGDPLRPVPAPTGNTGIVPPDLDDNPVPPTIPSEPASSLWDLLGSNFQDQLLALSASSVVPIAPVVDVALPTTSALPEDADSIVPEVPLGPALNKTDTSQAVSGLFAFLDDATKKQLLDLLVPAALPTDAMRRQEVRPPLLEDILGSTDITAGAPIAVETSPSALLPLAEEISGSNNLTTVPPTTVGTSTIIPPPPLVPAAPDLLESDPSTLIQHTNDTAAAKTLLSLLAPVANDASESVPSALAPSVPLAPVVDVVGPVADDLPLTPALEKADTNQAVGSIFSFLDDETRDHLLSLLKPIVATTDVPTTELPHRLQEVQPNSDNKPASNISENLHDTEPALFIAKDPALVKNASVTKTELLTGSWEALASTLSAGTKAKLDEIILYPARTRDYGNSVKQSLSESTFSKLLDKVNTFTVATLLQNIESINSVDQSRLASWITGSDHPKGAVKSLIEAMTEQAGSSSQNVLAQALAYANTNPVERNESQRAVVMNALRDAITVAIAEGKDKRRMKRRLDTRLDGALFSAGDDDSSSHFAVKSSDLRHFIEEFHKLEPNLERLSREQAKDLAAIFADDSGNIDWAKWQRTKDAKLPDDELKSFFVPFYLLMTDIFPTLTLEEQDQLNSLLLDGSEKLPMVVRARQTDLHVTDADAQGFLEQQLYAICPSLANSDLPLTTALITKLEDRTADFDTSVAEFKARLLAYTTSLKECMDKVTGTARKLRDFAVKPTQSMNSTQTSSTVQLIASSLSSATLPTSLGLARPVEQLSILDLLDLPIGISYDLLTELVENLSHHGRDLGGGTAATKSTSVTATETLTLPVTQGTLSAKSGKSIENGNAFLFDPTEYHEFDTYLQANDKANVDKFWYGLLSKEQREKLQKEVEQGYVDSTGGVSKRSHVRHFPKIGTGSPDTGSSNLQAQGGHASPKPGKIARILGEHGTLDPFGQLGPQIAEPASETKANDDYQWTYNDLEDNSVNDGYASAELDEIGTLDPFGQRGPQLKGQAGGSEDSDSSAYGDDKNPAVRPLPLVLEDDYGLDDSSVTDTSPELDKIGELDPFGQLGPQIKEPNKTAGDDTASTAFEGIGTLDDKSEDDPSPELADIEELDPFGQLHQHYPHDDKHTSSTQGEAVTSTAISSPPPASTASPTMKDDKSKSAITHDPTVDKLLVDPVAIVDSPKAHTSGPKAIPAHADENAKAWEDIKLDDKTGG